MATASATASAGSAAHCRTSSSWAVGITASVHVDAGRARDPQKGFRISSKRRSRNVKMELQAATTRRMESASLPLIARRSRMKSSARRGVRFAAGRLCGSSPKWPGGPWPDSRPRPCACSSRR